jgi:hypothetical protein
MYPYPQQPPQQPQYYPPQAQYPRQSVNQYWSVPPAQYQKGKTLVFWSRMLLLASGLVFVASCGITIAGVPQALVGLGLGALIVIAAAVVGSIGRGIQGRIV